MTTVIIFLTFFFYLIYECSRPLTYYQAKLQSEYYDAEDKIFKEKMEQKVCLFICLIFATIFVYCLMMRLP